MCGAIWSKSGDPNRCGASRRMAWKCTTIARLYSSGTRPMWVSGVQYVPQLHSAAPRPLRTSSGRVKASMLGLRASPKRSGNPASMGS